MSGSHTRFCRNKRILISFRDGTTCVCRFHERKKPYVYVDGGSTRYHLRTIRNMSVYQPQPHDL